MIFSQEHDWFRDWPHLWIPQICINLVIDYFLTTDKTRRFQYLLFLLFLAPQVSKSVNDDTKDEVEDNDDDHEEEKQVVDHSGSKKGLLLNPNT